MSDETRNYEMEAALAALKAAALSIFLFYWSRTEPEMEGISEANKLLTTGRLASDAVKAVARGLPDGHPLLARMTEVESDLIKEARFRRKALKID